jgi:transposase-like protein
LRVYDFVCPSCNFESRNQIGTPDSDQILTDVNTEFAHYKLFACLKEKKFVGANVLDPGFDGKCPSDGSALQEVNIEGARCPRCGSELKVEEKKPLSTGDASAE